MKNIAIIPARGGSKRIPRKNIKEFLGKPIIAYSIEAALKSKLFDEVMVSTDDDEIAEIAKKYGASVPFFRSEQNSDDFSGPGDVVEEVIQEFNAQGIHFTNVCCIYATAPFISENRLIEGYELLQTGKYGVVMPIAEFHFPIFRSLKQNSENIMEMNFPEYETKRSQDIPPAYHDAGQFYWVETKKFLAMENKNIFGNSKGGVLLNPLEVQDIDNESDWNLAEFKYQYLQNIKDNENT